MLGKISLVARLVSLGAATHCWAGCEGKPLAAEASNVAARDVKLVRAQQTSLERTVVISGALAADEQVTVAVKVPGRLSLIAVDLASVVKQGDMIAQVERHDYQMRVEQAAAAVAQVRVQLGLVAEGTNDEVDIEQTALVRQAKATLAEAQADVTRKRTLAQEGLATGAERESAEASFSRAESAVQTAREEVRLRQATLRQRRSELRQAGQLLADTAVRAPIDGIVLRRLVNTGEYVAAGAPVAEIVRIDPLRLKLAIPERDAASVRQGQDVRVLVDGDATAYLGKVMRLAPSLDQQNRTLLVEADLANPGSLRPGFLARAHIVVGSSPAPTVPASAVVSFAGVEKVLVVDGGKALEKRVKTGARVGDRVEIVSGLKVGEAVVLAPGSLQQGQAVRVIREH